MNILDLILISVIVPIYNVEKYLDECLDSIIKQSYGQLEIILVDDGSSDGSGAIADKYAKLDSRIKVIHKDNGGLSEARNTGLEMSNGEWIVFVDADDRIHPQMIELLYQTAKETESELVWCLFTEFDNQSDKLTQTTKQNLVLNKNCYQEMTNIEASGYFYKLGKMSEFMVAWNKIYKRNLFFDEKNLIRYPVGKIFEDGYTTYQLVYKAAKVTRLEIPLYDYRIHSESIMAKHGNKSYLPAIEAGIQRMDFFAAREEWELYKAELNLNIYSLIRYYEGNSDKEIKKEIKTQFCAFYKQYFKKETWPIFKRIRMYSFYIGYPMYQFISSFERLYNRLTSK